MQINADKFFVSHPRPSAFIGGSPFFRNLLGKRTTQSGSRRFALRKLANISDFGDVGSPALAELVIGKARAVWVPIDSNTNNQGTAKHCHKRDASPIKTLTVVAKLTPTLCTTTAGLSNCGPWCPERADRCERPRRTRHNL
jgi:hypothetical protein